MANQDRFSVHMSSPSKDGKTTVSLQTLEFHKYDEDQVVKTLRKVIGAHLFCEPCDSNYGCTFSSYVAMEIACDRLKEFAVD